MSISTPSRMTLWTRTLSSLLIAVTGSLTTPAVASIEGLEDLLSLYAVARSTLDNPTPEQPMYLRAAVEDYVQTGEAAVYFEQSVDEIADTLSRPGSWCTLLLLHLNTKACTHSTRDNRSTLTIYLGRKFYQDPDDAFVMTYDFQTLRADHYFLALITAEEGPLGTSNYRIQFEVTDVDDKTFGRIQVSQEHSWVSSKAAKLYVSTKGRNKLGISVVNHDAEGNPVYSTGERAIAERNLLRYQFAFTAFFQARGEPQKRQFTQSMVYWFDQTEQYNQLYEVERTQYIEDKSKEHKNQVALQRLVDYEDRHAAKDR